MSQPTNSPPHADSFKSSPDRDTIAEQKETLESCAYRRVCYVTNWAQGRASPAQWFPEKLDASLCTHAIFAFANVVGNDIQPTQWNDQSTALTVGMYDRLNNLKLQHPHMKTLLAIGGKSHGSRPFTAMAASVAGRREFAQNAVKYLRTWNFDGLDVDWEYPANTGIDSSPPEDRERFVLLLQDLRQVFDAEALGSENATLLLGIVGHARKTQLEAGYDIYRIASVVDFISILSYGYHDKREGETGINAPLRGRVGETTRNEHSNLEFSADYYVRLGAPREKLNIGLAMYGHSYTLVDANAHGVGAPVLGDGQAGRYTQEYGLLAYYEICEMLQQGATRYWHAEHQAPYAVLGNQWVGYDDPESLQYKIDYVKHARYGGVMIWAADMDDFQNLCGSGPYPLMRTIMYLLTETGATSHIRTRPSSHTDLTTQVSQSPNTTVSQSPTPHRISTRDFSCGGRPDGFYAHRTLCAQYYWCVLSNVYLRTCPPGLMFDTRHSQCFYADQVNCTGAGSHSANWTLPPRHPRNTTITTEPTTAPATTSIPAFSCQGQTNGYYADASSCASYFMCTFGTKNELTCMDGLLFDVTLKYCTYASQVNCASRPRPTRKRRSTSKSR